jgi:hypothetical protein
MRTKPKQRSKDSIPPPPNPREGHQAVIQYFQEHTPEELDRSGHLAEPSADELKELEVSAGAALKQLAELRLRLPLGEFRALDRLAARKKTGVAALATRWLRERIREERGSR